MNNTEVKVSDSVQPSEKKWFISALRLLSTAFIVLCHALQFYGHFLAWWFNVGVQIFFLISGYLHAGKEQKPWLPFMKHKLFILLPEYFLYGFVVIFAYSFVMPVSDILYELVKLLLITGSTSLSSLAHFWFMPVIIFCYFLTPYFNTCLDTVAEYRGGVCTI